MMIGYFPYQEHQWIIVLTLLAHVDSDIERKMLVGPTVAPITVNESVNYGTAVDSQTQLIAWLETFSDYWYLVKGIHRSPMYHPHK